MKLYLGKSETLTFAIVAAVDVAEVVVDGVSGDLIVILFVCGSLHAYFLPF